MREIVRRAIGGRPELIAELCRRGMFRPEEKAELLRRHSENNEEPGHIPLGTVQLATLLAQGDVQFAAQAVLRGMLDKDELHWLDRLLRFQKPNKKRDELTRIVERTIEGRKGNAGSPR
jgi:hypothetical protein